MIRRITIGVTALGLLATSGLVAALWYGSGLILRPPWYQHRSPEEGLRPLEGDAFLVQAWDVIHDPKRDLDIDFEEVEFPAVEGSTLRGWFVPGRPDATIGVVTVHGGAADRREFLRHLPVFHDPGYPVLLFDCREQGISDGDAGGMSLGIREHEDVSSAVAYMKQERGLERVAVVGTSQGGASVILAGAADPGIDAVIAENPFTSIAELVRDAEPAAGQPRDFLMSLVIWTALWRMGGLDVPAPIDVIEEIAPRPLLLMHGDADQVIPVEQTRELYLATGGHAELWIAPGAGHANLYDAYPAEWTERVQGLLFDELGPPAPRGVADASPVAELHP